MDIWSSALVSLFFLLAAAGLMAWHVRAWRLARSRQLEAEDLDYRWRQFRRRMQSTAMLGLLAVAIVVGQLIVLLHAPPAVILGYFGGVFLLVIWLGLLVAADIVATKYHFGKMRNHCLIEQAKLQAELRRIQRLRSNGEPGSKSKGPRVDD